jgi:hypothetical protein
MIHPQKTARRFALGLLALGLAAVVASAPVDAQQPGKDAKNKAGGKGKNAQRATQVAPLAPRSALLTQKIWENVSRLPLRPGEIDQLIAKELQSDKIEAAPLTNDEQFIRRVSLDLTGQLPLPADVKEFSANSDPDKRAKLIDRFLASDEYAAHWARYWRDVIGARVTDRRGLLLAKPFELWLTDQFKKNQGWDKIVCAMICAEGPCRIDDEGKNGAAFFLACHFGPDSAVEQAAETSRLFLGIQIQCAQCHDHPSDQWKRVQFHQLVGYFARLQDRPIRTGMGPAGIELVSLPRGEHEMPSKENPSKLLLTPPRFLDGSAPGTNLTDKARRKALADAIVSKKNCWFAAAYVNRLWGELMGQSFYQPIDDMGPEKPAVFGSVLTRLTGALQGTDYDVKGFFRAIMKSATYQRQIRLGESAEQHLHFAAAYPTRLRADALWESLTGVLGILGNPLPAQQRGPAALMGARTGMEVLFKQEFSFDPSLKADEVEGSISQALMMMNNPVINQRIQARGSNLVARILTAYPDDREAIKMVYLRSLARKPTDREMEKCCQYIDNSESRESAFEDILWALVNSTEFQTKR